MPPFRHILLRLLRMGAIGASAFAAGVLGIEVWKHWGNPGGLNPGFAILVGVVFLAGVWLARAIGREIAAFPPRNGS